MSFRHHFGRDLCHIIHWDAPPSGRTPTWQNCKKSWWLAVGGWVGGNRIPKMMTWIAVRLSAVTEKWQPNTRARFGKFQPTTRQLRKENISSKKHFESIWVCGNLGEKKHQHELSEICLVSRATQPNQQHPTNLVGPSLVPRNAHQPTTTLDPKKHSTEGFPPEPESCYMPIRRHFHVLQIDAFEPSRYAPHYPPKKSEFSKIRHQRTRNPVFGHGESPTFHCECVVIF